MDHQFFLNQLIVEQEKETYSNKIKDLIYSKNMKLCFYSYEHFFWCYFR
jgi:hypothetical protein